MRQAACAGHPLPALRQRPPRTGVGPRPCRRPTGYPREVQETRKIEGPSTCRVDSSPSLSGRGSASAPRPSCLPAILPTRRLAYPPRLRERLRSTNLLERSLGEVKRRTKIIGRFPGETSCLRLCWAVMDLVITAGRGLPRPHRFRAPTVRPDPRRPGHPITPRDDRVRCSHCAEKRLHFTAARGRDRAARGHLANDTS